jgi:tetratricopeptide (TPR) repeat protein
MFDDEEDFSEKELKSDIALFERYLKGESVGFIDGDRIESIIDFYLFNSNYSFAKSASEFGISQLPHNEVFYLRKAQSLAGLGLISESIEILRQLEIIENHQSELLLTKAALYGQIRDSKNAIKCYRQALELCEDQEKDEIFVDLALEYENSSDFDGAIEILKNALRHNPKNEIAFSELCYCMEKSERIEEMNQQILAFIDENPYSYLGWYQLGSFYLRKEDYDKAIWAFDYCLIINESAGAAYFNLGNAYLSSDRFHQAIDSFKKCMEIDGEDPLALCYLGESYENIHEYELSKSCYQKSIELSPEFSEPWLGLGIIADLQENTGEAIVLMNKALDLDPENPVIHHLVGAAYLKNNELELGFGHLKKSLELDPTDMDCLKSLMENLVKIDILESQEFIHAFNLENGEETESWLWEVNTLWLLGSKEDSIALFSVCIDNDSMKSKELFTINPQLLHCNELTDLVDLSE